MSGPAIFIGYRREDTADSAGRIYDYLETKFSSDRVFKDVDSIPAGSNFRGHVEGVIGQCRVFLVLIGPSWLTARNVDGSRRLDDAEDLVRVEIELALLHPNVDVLPVLIAGAEMPAADELPVSVRTLAERHAAEVRRDPDFRRDIERLISSIERILNSPVRQNVLTEPISTSSLLAFVERGDDFLNGFREEEGVDGPAEAARLYKLAADQGYSYAYYNLARLYLDGQGVPESESEAFRLLKIAADNKHSGALYDLVAYWASWYKDQVGILSAKEAFRYTKMAADQGDVWAYQSLGVMYAVGLGVPQSYPEAAHFYRLAIEHSANEGSLAEDSAFRLGELYENGLGVPTNIEEAQRYYQIALDLDCDLTEAVEALKRLASVGNINNSES